MRLQPADLNARELAERSRLVPDRHVVMLTNGRWCLVRERVELGGFVVGFRGDVLENLEGEPVSFELAHVAEWMEAWELVRILERAGAAVRRARELERWRDDWRRPVGAGRVFSWMADGDARAREPEWKRRLRDRQRGRAT